MVNKSEELAERYYSIIQEDKKYWEKYESEEKDNDIEKVLYDFFYSSLKWRQKQYSKEELEKIIINNGKDLNGLLQIEMYYFDGLCELESEHFKISDYNLLEEDDGTIFEETNFDDIMKDNNNGQQIKDCIKIYKEASQLCKEIYDFLNKQKN